MIRVNLLPWRDELRNERRQRFYIACGAVVVLSVLVGYIVFASIERKVSAQYAVNSVLSTEINKLNKEIKEIARLEELLGVLKGRSELIESLQKERGETVRVLSDLVHIVPEGVVLTGLQQKGKSISLLGESLSNARVSTLMRNVEASQLLDNPVLIETRVSKREAGDQRLQTFNVKVLINRNKNEPIDAEVEERK